MQGKRLFDEFRPVTPEQWKEKIIKDLKCEDFDSKLVWRAMEGTEVMPFHTRRDIQNMPYIGSLPGEVPFLRGPDREGRKWLIREDIRVDDYKKANAKCLEILMRGVDSPGFIVDDPETVNRQNLEALLSGIHPDAVPVNFAPSGKAKEIIEILTEMAADSGFDPARIKAMQLYPQNGIILFVLHR